MSRYCDHPNADGETRCGNLVSEGEDHCRAGHPCASSIFDTACLAGSAAKPVVLEIEDLLAEPPTEISELQSKQEHEVRALYDARDRVLREQPLDAADLVAAIHARLLSYPPDVRHDQECIARALRRAAEHRAFEPVAVPGRRRWVAVGKLSNGTSPDIDIYGDDRVTPEMVDATRRRLIAGAAEEMKKFLGAHRRVEMAGGPARVVLAAWVASHKQSSIIPGVNAGARHLIATDKAGRGYFVAWDAARGWTGAFYTNSEPYLAIEEEMARAGLTRAVVFGTVRGSDPPHKHITFEKVTDPDVVEALAYRTARYRHDRLTRNEQDAVA